MYPNNSPQPPQAPAPLDYLNQIAPQSQNNNRFTRKQLLIGSIAVILLVVAVAIMALGGLTGSTKPLEHLTTRLTTTAKIASSSQNTIKDDNLQALNVTLQLDLTNINRSIATPLAEQKIDAKNIDKTIIASEASTTITNRLEDARLNAVYDNTYAREMAYQLSTVINLMEQINNTSSNKDLKSFLTQSLNDLIPLQKDFSVYNSTRT